MLDTVFVVTYSVAVVLLCVNRVFLLGGVFMHLRSDGSGLYSNRHSVFLLSYHLVLVTRYHHPVMTDEIATWVREYFECFFRERGLRIQALEVMPDHVHVLFDAPPQVALSEFIQALKTGSSRRVRTVFAKEISKYYWKPYFWSKSYFICSVGDKTTEIVKHYIENQKE